MVRLCRLLAVDDGDRRMLLCKFVVMLPLAPAMVATTVVEVALWQCDGRHRPSRSPEANSESLRSKGRRRRDW